MSVLLGARVGERYRISEALWDNPGRGRYRGTDGQRSVLIAVTAPQQATQSDLQLRLGLPLPGITPLCGIEDVASPLGTLDSVVEQEPSGRPLSAWRDERVSRPALLALAIAVADVMVGAHARGFALGGVRPELIYAEQRDGRLALTAIAPRAIAFFATGKALDTANVPAFADVYEPTPISMARKLPTPVTDVFTFACAFGTLFAGEHPFATGSWARQIDAMSRRDGRWPEVDDPILRVLESALVLDAAARPKASALCDRLRGVSNG